MKLLTTLILFLSLLPATIASSDIVWKGTYFAHKQEIISTYEKSPHRGRDKNINVMECSDDEWEPVNIMGDEVLLGLYWTKTDSLWVHSEKDWDIGETFLHELGHHLYYKELTEVERDDWKKWWGENKDEMPRDYARSCASEGFAESFMVTYIGYKTPHCSEPSSKLKTKIISYFIENGD